MIINLPRVCTVHIHIMHTMKFLQLAVVGTLTMCCHVLTQHLWAISTGNGLDWGMGDSSEPWVEKKLQYSRSYASARTSSARGGGCLPGMGVVLRIYSTSPRLSDFGTLWPIALRIVTWESMLNEGFWYSNAFSAGAYACFTYSETLVVCAQLSLSASIFVEWHQRGSLASDRQCCWAQQQECSPLLFGRLIVVLWCPVCGSDCIRWPWYKSWKDIFKFASSY